MFKSELPYSRITLRPNKEEDRPKFLEFRVNDIGKMFPLFCIFDVLFVLVLWAEYIYSEAAISKLQFTEQMLVLFLNLATWYLKSKLQSDTWINLVLFNLYLESMLHVLGSHISLS